MKRTAWNSTLPAPTKTMKRTRLKSGTKPLERTTRLKTRRVSKRFSRRRNPDYRAFIRTFPCCLIWRDGQHCSGKVECAHVVSRAAGGFDVGDTVPLCHGHHESQHRTGIQSFQDRHGIDLKKSASLIAEMWKLAKGYPTEVSPEPERAP